MTVFVLRALGIGDLATGVPALRAIRARYPDERIELGAPAWVAPLAELTDAVDAVVPGIPSAPIAVNLHGRGPESHRALLATRPGRLLAFACPAAGFADGPVWYADEHEVDRWCRLLAWYGIPAEPGDLALRVPAAPPLVDGATIVHPGAKEARRRWPVARFAAVARELERHGHHVVVTGGDTDVARAREVCAGAGLPPDRVLAGRTDVAELAALVAAARLVVSGDTGIAHLATGYGTPSVVLFGPISPALWGPPPDRPQHRALWAGPAHPTVDALAVADVLAAALDSRFRPRSGRVAT